MLIAARNCDMLQSRAVIRSSQILQRCLLRTMATKEVTKFDYLVLGGGSGGVASVRRSTEFGISAGIIEHGRLGGTCVS